MKEIERQDVVACFGRKGSGKSELARALWTEHESPRVLIDVKDEHEHHLPGIPTVDSPAAVFDAANPTVRVVPNPPDAESFYEELFARALEEGNIVVWFDEVNAVTSPNYVPPAVKRYVLQGRTRRAGLIGCTPRPADIHPVFLSQADHVVVFPVRHALDRQAIARHIDTSPAELVELLEELPQHGFLHYDAATAQLVKMRPVHDADELTERIRQTYFGPYRPHWLT